MKSYYIFGTTLTFVMLLWIWIFAPPIVAAIMTVLMGGCNIIAIGTLYSNTQQLYDDLKTTQEGYRRTQLKQEFLVNVIEYLSKEKHLSESILEAYQFAELPEGVPDDIRKLAMKVSIRVAEDEMNHPND